MEPEIEKAIKALEEAKATIDMRYKSSRFAHGKIAEAIFILRSRPAVQIPEEAAKLLAAIEDVLKIRGNSFEHNPLPAYMIRPFDVLRDQTNAFRASLKPAVPVNGTYPCNCGKAENESWHEPWCQSFYFQNAVPIEGLTGAITPAEMVVITDALKEQISDRLLSIVRRRLSAQENV